jgi:hypothetical protein
MTTGMLALARGQPFALDADFGNVEPQENLPPSQF